MRFKPIPFGKYYLLDRVNTGGMAEVFRAKAFGVEGFERIVAVKRILPSIAADTDFITMFIDEAKLAVQLNHANIAQIFDLGKVADNYFIALEYVHGKDLRAVFDLVRKRSLRVPIEMACYVMMKICEGLEYAHRKRDSSGRDLELIHRDVSPQNMLISFDGDVKLIDFGIAKAAGKSSHTRTGVLKGKFGYLSPEQVRGEVIDQRSDLFGIGIVLYELLTGERLFVGDSDFSTIEKVRSVEIVPPRGLNANIPKSLESAVMRALSRDRDTRFQSALELHDELQTVLHERARRGQTFGRKELSAWMVQHFPKDAARDPEEVGDLEGAESLASSSTDVTPTVEPTESNAVYKETRDAPEKAKNKQPSTILGMPAVLPPADLASPLPGSRASVPPPPPRGGKGLSTRPPAPPSPGLGRSVPPPPPRTQPPAPPPGYRAAESTPAPRRGAQQPPARTAPPPPPSSANARGPSLNMDWDDEELSTQIYDRPADATDYLYESNEDSSFDESLAAARAYEEEQQERDEYPDTPVPYSQSQRFAQPVAPAQAYQEPQYGRPAQQYAQPVAQPQTTAPRQQPNYGTGTMGGYPAVAQQYDLNNYGQDQYAAFGPGAAAPDGVHVSPRAYANSEVPPAPHVEPAGSLRAPPANQTVSMTTERPGDRGRNPLYAALAVAAVVLMCFVGYVFLRSTEPGVVQLTAHPADAVLLFDGKQVGASSPFFVTGVSPNDKHTVEVQKAGYRTWTQEFQVQAGQTLQFPVTLQPASDTGEALAVGAAAQQATGGFSIETSPSGAAVVLNGQALSGVTPLRVGNLLPRTYDVRVRLAGFKEQQVPVEVRSGVDQSLPRIALAAERVRVRVTSEPSGGEAVLTRGGERRTLGRTPIDVTLENDGSPWNVEINKSGYEAYAQPVTIEGGSAEQTVRAVLSRKAASSVDDSAPALAASEPPRSASRPASSSESGSASPRESSSSSSRESSSTSSSRESASASSREPSSESGSGQGTLRINSRPWSQVTIDGRAIGNTPQMNVALPSGNHRVQLVNPEFNLKKTLTITIKPGQTETQIISLQ